MTTAINPAAEWLERSNSRGVLDASWSPSSVLRHSIQGRLNGGQGNGTGVFLSSFFARLFKRLAEDSGDFRPKRPPSDEVRSAPRVSQHSTLQSTGKFSLF